ncbi:MAG: HlyD family efflux transporter periplasmic adaptor subunit, partial [Longimicrobiales bacterium]
VQQGRTLYSIAPLDTLVLRAYVSGGQLSRLELGGQAQVRFDTGDGTLSTRQGRISWISPASEFTPTPIQTREERVDQVYAVKVRVPNQDGRLKIGMPGELVLAIAEEPGQS